MEKTTAGSDDDPIITTLDRNCATFVRDILFPLRRDWGSGHNHRQHSTIHPALYALDRLRTDLIEKRNTTMSYSGIFPRGVLLVPNKTSSATTNGSSTVDNNNHNNNHGSMEWNGQPNIVESTVEVIPNVLSVKCVRCDAYSPNNNTSRKYTPSSANNSKAFMRQIRMTPESTGGGGGVQHELVVCSDRILQNDYYRQFGGGSGNDESSLLKEQPQQRREDMPIQSTRAIEETLIREITKLKVSECMLLRNQKETRMGSALKPSSLFLFSMLPTGIQHNFVHRCIQSVAIKYTTDAVNVFNNSEQQQKSNLNDSYANVVPKECIERAWKNINNNPSQQ
ncbi:hypothetical protein FRACYDRAFT_241104 [Fragilariopsis cylindrus CCMP1102]|uniref:Uncharacterized protein n=1 Tax=Fragilariopsis cylindrus CCMP1102 TaxID=635003 RepID=A0A1E7F8R6_9STRA|nr:hypothetical protein FRACYDRAFT_241104 [Fragilariopsis cylindrus CCMP1102]|eukprot:OEU14557.1 hypothetical protein FRACYDRAFT_241104 [Fragilariopsis cylindrus CCMP1102]